jgi:hypothetical protein
MLENMGLKDKKEEIEEEKEEVEHLDLTGGASNKSQQRPVNLPPPSEAGQPPPVTVVHVPSSSTGPSVEDENITFESVEMFSIDPDFDYDNVKLTPRGFPYNIGGPKPFPFFSQR